MGTKQQGIVFFHRSYGTLNGKPCFLFPDSLKKDCLSKKIALEYFWIFLVLPGKMKFLSAENMIAPRRNMILLVLSGKMVFFPENMIFFPGQKVRDNLSQKIYRNIFSVCTHACYKHGVTPFCQKKSKMVLSRKNTPKGDRRSRLDILERAPAILCTFMEAFKGVFMFCSLAKKTQET